MVFTFHIESYTKCTGENYCDRYIVQLKYLDILVHTFKALSALIAN